MAKLTILLGLLFVAGAQVHTGEGESDNVLEGGDFVWLKDPALGLENEEELGDVVRGEGKPVMGRNVTFDISGFSVGREVENLVAKENHERKEDDVEEEGVIDTKEEDWIEGSFIEGVQRFVLVIELHSMASGHAESLLKMSQIKADFQVPRPWTTRAQAETSTATKVSGRRSRH